jgi:magnesium transporter
MPPGSLVYTGAPKEGDTTVTLITYDKDNYSRHEATSFKEISGKVMKDAVNWIHFDSLHNPSLIEEAGKLLRIHQLVLEDILDVGHPPKIEAYDEYIFLTMKAFKRQKEEGSFRFEHISLVLGKNFLLTFLEHKGDPFDPIRERLEAGKGRSRGRSADYLFILLADAIVDQYFFADEIIDKENGDIEIEIYENPSESSVNRIVRQKKELNRFKKEVYPIAESFRLFLPVDSDLISPENIGYFNDINDHLKQIVDTINTYHESLTAMMEFYMIRISNQMNQVMKTLTLIATIFIPLTFIVGIYGMNFNFMPELEWKWSYPILMIAMLAIGLVMYIYMRKKRWF